MVQSAQSIVGWKIRLKEDLTILYIECVLISSIANNIPCFQHIIMNSIVFVDENTSLLLYSIQIIDVTQNYDDMPFD